MNKNKKKCIIAIASLFVLMMTAASVNADENDEPGILDRLDVDPDAFAENMTDDSTSTYDEPNLIAPSPVSDEEPNLITPSPNTYEEPLIIAPMDSMKNEDALLGDNALTAGLILVIGISGFVSLAIALVIFKK
jgi:hypothetical protein